MEAFFSLDHTYRLTVIDSLTSMLGMEEPWLEYGHHTCAECLDGVYILNLPHEETGELVQLMARFDEGNLLVPLHCELVS